MSDVVICPDCREVIVEWGEGALACPNCKKVNIVKDEDTD